MTDLSTLKLSKTLREAVEVVQNSQTLRQYEHRMRILAKLEAVLGQEGPDEEKLGRIMADFELFCVVFVRLDDLKPMFPAIWQSQVLKVVEGHRRNLFVECRKIGKSAFLSSYVVWRACTRAGERVVIFAPTTQQLYVMEDVYKIIGRNQFLMENYVGAKGTYGKEHVRFSANESEIKSSNLALSQEADTKRGEKGALVIVDEIELVTEDIRHFVIDDMLADTYTEKKIIMVGTPKDIANPKLEEEWRAAQGNPKVGTHHIDMWEGVSQGCISREWVMERFAALRIGCPWGLFEGLCGRREFPGDKYVPEDPESHWNNWECNECCLQNEAFVAENLGEFPAFAGRFIPKPFLLACGKPDYIWEVMAEPGAKYVIGVDYGLLVNPTQIVVLKMMGDHLKLAYWREMPPVKPGDETREGSRSYDPVVQAVQDTYWRFAGKEGDQVRWMFVDATQPGIQVTHDLTKGSKAIPSSRFWSNDAAKVHELKGIWFSGPYKDMMMQNYRKLIMDGKLGVPDKEPFWSLFLGEHDSLQVEPVGSSTQNYMKYQPKRGGTIDLIVALALAALITSQEVKSTGPYAGFVHLRTGVSRPLRGVRSQPSLQEDVGYVGLFQD